LQLTLTVVDTKQMRQLDTDVIEGNRGNFLSLQDAAVAKLSNLLDLRIDPRHARDIGEMRPIAPGAHEFYVRGRGYLQRNDQLAKIDTAIGLFEKAIQTDSAYALPHAGLCEAYWYKYQRTGEATWVDEALASCEHAFDLNDQQSQVHVTMGRVHQGTGKYSEAVQDFEKALDLDPRNGEAFEGLGRAYTTLGRFQEAEATYQKAVRLRPGDWKAYKALGRFYLERGQYEQAADQFTRVVELTPDSAQGYANLGSAYYFAGKLDNAQRNWEASVEIEPRASALSNLATLLMNQEQYGLAAERYRQAIELRPNTFALWGNLAGAYLRAGDDRATEAYRKAAQLTKDALAVSPGREELFSYLAKYSLGAGDRREAERWIAKAARRETKHHGELIRNADTYEQLGERDNALDMVRRVFEAGARPQAVEKSRPLRELILDSRYQTLAREYASSG
jgi:tetratricopeptide (TPR) repeat protein